MQACRDLLELRAAVRPAYAVRSACLRHSLAADAGRNDRRPRRLDRWGRTRHPRTDPRAACSRMPSSPVGTPPRARRLFSPINRRFVSKVPDMGVLVHGLIESSGFRRLPRISHESASTRFRILRANPSTKSTVSNACRRSHLQLSCNRGKVQLDEEGRTQREVQRISPRVRSIGSHSRISLACSAPAMTFEAFFGPSHREAIGRRYGSSPSESMSPIVRPTQPRPAVHARSLRDGILEPAHAQNILHSLETGFQCRIQPLICRIGRLVNPDLR